jgi:hypothetical protein
MQWLQRWNFIAHARLEREIWEAFERGENLEELVQNCPPGLKQHVWQKTLLRIRRMEKLMAGRQPPQPPA